MTKRFSDRYGVAPSNVAITVREDAPDGLRYAVSRIAYEAGFGPHAVRKVVCRVLRVMPDDNNFSAFPNVDHEVSLLLAECAWYKVYDVIEALHSELEESRAGRADVFEAEINKYFAEYGIGWKLVNGEIETRGGEPFERAVKRSREALSKAGLSTASAEIHEALVDLSRRPSPDLTGAIHHAMAALECAARAASGDSNATISEVVRRFPGLIPKPLDAAIDKVYGYTSETGRHLREGGEPSRAEAELVVGVAATVAEYLGKKVSQDA